MTLWVTRVALSLRECLPALQTYYERLQAEAEQQLEAKNSEVCSGVVQDSKQTAEEQGDVRAHGLKSQSSHPQWSSSGSQSKVMFVVLDQAGNSVAARHDYVFRHLQ